jgi:hypothetical protein
VGQNQGVALIPCYECEKEISDKAAASAEAKGSTPETPDADGTAEGRVWSPTE